LALSENERNHPISTQCLDSQSTTCVTLSDKRFNVLESKIDKLPGRISRQIFAAVASFTGIIAAVVAVTMQAMN
jgi:hypothetical protein